MPYKEAFWEYCILSSTFPLPSHPIWIFVLCYKYVGGKLGQGFSQKDNPIKNKWFQINNLLCFGSFINTYYWPSYLYYTFIYSLGFFLIIRNKNLNLCLSRSSCIIRCFRSRSLFSHVLVVYFYYLSTTQTRKPL